MPNSTDLRPTASPYRLPRRPRRNRRTAALRGLMRETHLTPDHLVYPLFLTDGQHVQEEIASLPGNYRWSLDRLLPELEQCWKLGLRSFMIFPKISGDHKDETGSYGIRTDNYYLRAVREIRREFPDMCLISDTALDPYSVDGHDGVVRGGVIQNDETLDILAKMAVAQAEAGFDLLGPSDMMDGRIGVMRDALDAAGFAQTGIMSYTAKYASGFYGPFRDALDSAPATNAQKEIPGDKKTYQMDPANRREALLEAQLDTEEGADFLMVKPALNYLDVILELRQHSELPIAAYHVSGECAMLLAACQKGWLDYEVVMPETLLSIHRAGADVVISYFAKDFAARYAR